MLTAEQKNLKRQARQASQSLAQCARLADQIRCLKLDENERILKIAILSSYTLKGLSDCLISAAFLYDIYLEVYEGEYGQWQQEALRDKLYNFEPDIIFIFLDYFGLASDVYYSYHLEPVEKTDELLEDFLAEIRDTLNLIKNKSAAQIVISNIADFWLKPIGVINNKLKNSLSQAILKTNSKLNDEYRQDVQVYIFDFEGWLGTIGKDGNWYSKYFFLADMKLSPQSLPLLASELVAYLVPLGAKSRKCLVLDLDNTLWGGVIGEDGLGGIALSPSGAGQAYYYFQKLLLSYYHQGIILAINSKNNPADVKEVFQKHPYMLLKEKHFAVSRINWNDKVSNLREIAVELNIGLESLVFIDDDPVNRAMVNELLPEVEALELPDDPSLYLKTLLRYKGLQYLEFTDEDKQRGQMYSEERQRREFRASVLDLDDFLRSLELSIEVELLTELSLARAAQLTQKTNQFNLTTRRYQEEDIKKLISAGSLAWTLRVKDKFGDYGITGLMIVKPGKPNWLIDSLLLSCRILGKRIEEQFLNFILNELKQRGVDRVTGVFIPTKKNDQARDFFQKMGFRRMPESELGDNWELALENWQFKPFDFIRINEQ